MLKRTISAFLFLLILGGAAYAQTKCEKYIDKSFGISFCIPKDWMIKEVPGSSAFIYSVEMVDKVAPNINIQGGTFVGTLSKAADSAEAVVLKLKLQDTVITKESRVSFVAGKSQGIKVVYKVKEPERTVRSIQYYFTGKGNTKIAITATLPWLSPETERLVDDAIKTYEVVK